ncbi:putative thioesterase [Rhodanobacter thiooxydans LCS2]|nr:putative thioesterase [Rhodanobacter thiooxydans LCS2]
MEQIAYVERTGACLGVTLEAERGPVGQREALQRAVEQRDVGDPHVRRQRGRIHREAMVLAGDQHVAVVQVLHRVVGAVVAELHLQRLAAQRQAHQLVAETDAEQRDLRLEELAGCRDGVVAGRRIAGAVGQEHAIGLHGEHLGGGRLRRHHGDLAALLGEQAQDVELGAEVVGDHLETHRGLVERGAVEVVRALLPHVRRGSADHLGQVHAVQAGKRAGLGQRSIRVDLLTGHDAAGECTLVAQDAGQPAGIDAGDRDRAVALQVVGQAFSAAPAAGAARQVTHDQPGRVHGGGFGIFGIDAGVADVRIGQRDDLACIGRIGEDLLVTGHGRVENHLADGFAGGTNGMAAKDAAVFEGQQGRNRHRGNRLLDTAKSASRTIAGLWSLVGKEIRAGRNDKRRSRFCPPQGT